MPVNKEAIAEWVAALRSGAYEQGHDTLVVPKNDGLAFCCLGVACEVFADRVGLERKQKLSDTYYLDRPQNDGVHYQSYMPPSLVQFLGVNSENPRVKWPGKLVTTQGLSSLNDRGISFPDIANAIEETFLKGDTDA